MTRGMQHSPAWPSFVEMLEAHATEAEILASLGVARCTTRKWRRKLGLAEGHAKGWGSRRQYCRAGQRAAPMGRRRTARAVRFTAEAITPYRDPCYARIASVVARGIAPDVRDDAISELYVAILSGEFAVDDVEKHARRFTGRELGRWQDRWTYSLDETHGETGWTMGALLACPVAPAAMDLALWRGLSGGVA